jgi:hypothetical protein
MRSRGAEGASPPWTLRSCLLGYEAATPDHMALRLGEHAERHSGHLLRRLDNVSAELPGTLQRGCDVLDAEKEQDVLITPCRGPIAVGSAPSTSMSTNV